MRIEHNCYTLVVLKVIALLFLNLLSLSEGVALDRAELLSVLMLIREYGFSACLGLSSMSGASHQS